MPAFNLPYSVLSGFQPPNFTQAPAIIEYLNGHTELMVAVLHWEACLGILMH